MFSMQEYYGFVGPFPNVRSFFVVPCYIKIGFVVVSCLIY